MEKACTESIRHMVAQVIETWKMLWKQNRKSRKQRHRRGLESFKEMMLKGDWKKNPNQVKVGRIVGRKWQ